MIGLAGPSGSGKSTLAKALETASDGAFVFVPSKASAICREMGVVPGEPLPFDMRMTLQERILDQHLADVRACGLKGNIWITDRTTLDMAAYTIADLGGHALTLAPEEDARLSAYVERCITTASWSYGMVLQLQPGIPYVANTNRPAPSVAFQETINTIIMGLCADERMEALTWRLDRSVVDLEKRIELLMKMWGTVNDRLHAEIGTQKHLH